MRPVLDDVFEDGLPDIGVRDRNRAEQLGRGTIGRETSREGIKGEPLQSFSLQKMGEAIYRFRRDRRRQGRMLRHVLVQEGSTCAPFILIPCGQQRMERGKLDVARHKVEEHGAHRRVGGLADVDLLIFRVGRVVFGGLAPRPVALYK